MILFCFSNYELKQVFYLIAITNLVNVSTCLSPFLPTDGYFIMTTLLKCPNMRKNVINRKIKVLDKKNIIKSLYVILSLCIIFFIFVTQITWIVKEIINAYNESLTLFQFIFRIKMFIIILAIIFIKTALKNKKKGTNVI